MKTIVLCSNTTFGIANFRAGVIRALLAEGHEVVVVAPRDGYVTQIEQLGARFEDWEMSGRSTSLLTEPLAVLRLYRIYRRVRPDFAFHYTIKSVIYGALIGRFTRTPVVSIITGLGYIFLNSGIVSTLGRAFYRATLRWSQSVWFLNHDDEKLFRELKLVDQATQVAVLPGEGIDLERFKPLPLAEARNPDELVILMIGRLLVDKGIYELVDAARSIRLKHPTVRVKLLGAVGGDNPTAISQAELNAWLHEGVIEHLGSVEDVRPAIQAADLVLLASYREGIPRSLLEAAAMGKPIIATDVPGCRDVVMDGRTGYLCRVRDPGDIAKKLEQFLSLSPEAKERMGQEGRRFVTDRFDERLVLAHYLNFLAIHR